MISLVPKGINIRTIVVHVVNHWKNTLFNKDCKFYCGLTGNVELFKAHLVLNIADSAASNSFIGMFSCNSECGCRLCCEKQKNFWPPHLYQPAEPRTSKNMLSYYRKYLRASVERTRYGRRAATRLKSLGLRRTPTPLLLITKDPFLRSPYCLLHQIFLGTRKDHLEMELANMSEADIFELNRRLRILNEQGWIRRISNIIYQHRWRGEEAAAFMAVAPIVLEGMILDAHLRVWRHHCAMIELLTRPYIREKDLDAIDHRWTSLLRGIYRCFPHRRFIGINWHAGYHWTECIRAFGVATGFSTERFEAQHGDMQMWSKVTNHQNYLIDVGIRTNVARSIELQGGSYKSLLEGLHIRLYQSQPPRTDRNVITPDGNTLGSRFTKRYCVFAMNRLFVSLC